jgi:hypothetical protein
MAYGNKLNKNQIIEKAIKENGFFMNTDGVKLDLDGKGLGEYLTKIGFEVIKYYDTGSNGIVLTKENIKVSTNGYVRHQAFMAEDSSHAI